MAKEEVGGCIAMVIIIVIVSEIVKFIQKYFIYLIYTAVVIFGIFVLIKIIKHIRKLPPRRKVVRVLQDYEYESEIKNYMNKLDKEFDNWNGNSLLRKEKI